MPTQTVRAHKYAHRACASAPLIKHFYRHTVFPSRHSFHTSVRVGKRSLLEWREFKGEDIITIASDRTK